MSYQPTKLAGYQLEINPAKFDWSAPKDIAKAPFIGGGTLGRDAGLPGDIIRFPGSIKKVDLPSLMAKRKLRRIVSFESDNCVRQGYTSGLVYVWIEDIQFTENPMDPASIRYPYDVRLSVVSDAGGFLCNGDEYKRGLKFNTFLIPHSFTLTEKPVIAYPNNITSPSQATSFTRTGEDGVIPCVANPVGNQAYYTVAEADLDKNDCKVGFDVTGHPYMKNGVLQLLGHLPTETRPGAFDVMYWNPAGAAYVKAGEWAPTVSSGTGVTDLAGQKATFEPGVNWLQDLCSGAVFWEGLTNGIVVRAYLVLRRGKLGVDTYMVNAGSTPITAHESRLSQFTQRYQQRYNVVMDAQAFPSTVVTNIHNNAIYDSQQQKIFWAAGLWWMFYGDTTNIIYRTSSDGATWSGPTTLRAVNIQSDFSLCWDGTYIHYAAMQNETAGTSAIFYRRGVPASDGTITWSAAEQTAVAAVANTFYFEPTITVNYAGNAYIGYGKSLSGTKTPQITKNANTDGTWSTAATFPLALSATTGNCGVIVLNISPTADSILAIYGFSSTTVKAKLWNGSSLGSEETASSTNLLSYIYMSAVASGSDVHLTFLNEANNIIYVKRTGSTAAWSAEVTVNAVSATSTPALELDDLTRNLYVFWLGSPSANHAYYKKYDALAGAWDVTATDWFTGTAFKSNDRILSLHPGGSIGIIYSETNGASNIDVKFALLIDDIPAGADDRNYNGLMSAVTEAVATIAGGTLTRNKGNGRRYRAVRSGSNWISISQGFGSGSTPITSGAYLERFWVYARKYENSADTMSELGKEALARVRQRQSLIRVV